MWNEFSLGQLVEWFQNHFWHAYFHVFYWYFFFFFFSIYFSFLVCFVSIEWELIICKGLSDTLERVVFQLYNELNKGANKGKIEKPKDDDFVGGFSNLIKAASLHVMNLLNLFICYYYWLLA